MIIDFGKITEESLITKIFMPTEVGVYNVTLTLDLHGAPKTKTFTFIVQEGLKGTNTIGAKGKYKSFNEAVDALYLQGVSGNVVFELIDDEPQDRPEGGNLGGKCW